MTPRLSDRELNDLDRSVRHSDRTMVALTVAVVVVTLAAVAGLVWLLVTPR